MSRMIRTWLLGLVCLVGLAAAKPAGNSLRHKRSANDVLVFGLSFLDRLRRDDDDCIPNGDDCGGTDIDERCCGDYTCNIEDDDYLTGICGDCPDTDDKRANYTCVFNRQCCADDICEKKGANVVYGHCAVRRGEGGDCNENAICQDGMFCDKGKADFGKLDWGTCQEKRDNGEKCWKDNHCKSGDCDFGWKVWKGGECKA